MDFQNSVLVRKLMERKEKLLDAQLLPNLIFGKSPWIHAYRKSGEELDSATRGS
jgi:hypothetical protein